MNARVLKSRGNLIVSTREAISIPMLNAQYPCTRKYTMKECIYVFVFFAKMNYKRSLVSKICDSGFKTVNNQNC